jgi:4-oxalocrotonate tautomerase
MPLIQVRVIKDVFSNEQKRQIISKLTDAMVARSCRTPMLV